MCEWFFLSFMFAICHQYHDVKACFGFEHRSSIVVYIVVVVVVNIFFPSSYERHTGNNGTFQNKYRTVTVNFSTPLKRQRTPQIAIQKKMKTKTSGKKEKKYIEIEIVIIIIINFNWIHLHQTTPKSYAMFHWAPDFMRTHLPHMFRDSSFFKCRIIEKKWTDNWSI